MTAEHLARSLAEAAVRTASRRAGLARSNTAQSTTEPRGAEQFRPVRPVEVPTGWWAYGRAIWPLGDDITDDRVLVEGTDRRSYAALNHYLRGGHDKAADRARALRRDIPAITEGRVGFERARDTVRVITHQDQAPIAALVAVLIAER